MKKLVAAAGIIFLSLGCSSTMKDWQKNNCSKSAATAQGLSDSHAGKPMDFTYANQCPDDIQVAVRTGYKSGYAEGINSLKPAKLKKIK